MIKLDIDKYLADLQRKTEAREKIKAKQQAKTIAANAELDFTIIIDSREQLPYNFYNSGIKTVISGLDAGDYSISGFEFQVAIERKSLNDLVSTLVHNRERFKVELLKLQKYELACIVVEASFSDILLQKYHSQVHPNSLVGMIVAVIVDYKIPVYFLEKREIAEKFTEKLLVRYIKNKLKQGQERP